MDIAGLNLRITFQLLALEVDDYGNHVNVWKDYFFCWATASRTGSKSGDEIEAAGTTNPQETVDFTVRWCKDLAAVSPGNCRIQADEKLYNILFIDPMGYYHRSLKFHCELVKR